MTLDDATDRIEFFVNGVSVASDTDAWKQASSSSQDTDPIVIGRNDETDHDDFSGVLDEVAGSYNGVLAPIQVQAHYLAGSWTPPQPLCGRQAGCATLTGDRHPWKEGLRVPGPPSSRPSRSAHTASSARVERSVRT